MHFEPKLQDSRVKRAGNEAGRGRAALAPKIGRVDARRRAGHSNARIEVINSVKSFQSEFNLLLLVNREDPGNGHIHVERPW